MYEMQSFAVLSSPAYAERLNNPTPWSTRMMPHHSRMVRSQCRVLASAGGGVARHALTLRLSPASGRDEALRAHLAGLVQTLALRAGLTGAHLLRHETPPIGPTQEQKIRGTADQVADWVLVVTGYDQATVAAAGANELAEATLAAQGAAHGPVQGLYTVAYSATPGDVA